MSKYKSISLFLIFSIIGLHFVHPLFGIRYTTSPSLPYKLFISRPGTQVSRNQYVTCTHPLSKTIIAKQVIGIAGDRISIYGDQIYINDQAYGYILKESKSGLKLQPLLDKIIPEGYIFAYASHQDSFDSRYQEFGLVKLEQLKEQLWPIF